LRLTGRRKLNGGVLDGKRLVSRKTIELMTGNDIGQIPMWQETLQGESAAGFKWQLRLGRRLRHVLLDQPEGADGRHHDDPVNALRALEPSAGVSERGHAYNYGLA